MTSSGRRRGALLSVGRLELIAFSSGAVVMVLEITGSRAMAPYLGTSVFVWTTLIGIIMASLSLGYWWGGRLADREPTLIRLAAILFLACLFSTATALLQSSFLAWLQDAALELRLAAILATVVLFAPASTMLGMVTPFVVRLKLRAIEDSGAAVGRLYAISTAGSIFGTFVCGYFLLAWMGTSRILYGLSALLLILSILAAVEYRPGQRAAAGVFLLLTGALAEFDARQKAAAGFVDIDTAYQRLQVIDTTEGTSRRPLRILKAEEANTQSAMYLDGDDLASAYLGYFDLVRQTGRPLRRVLMIGAAGCVFPRHLVRELPQTAVDVVELDPAMTVIARRFFGLGDDPRLRIFHEDGRTWVNRAAQTGGARYDAVLIDAFQTRVPPFQLLTAEFVAKLEKILSPEGVVVLNFIARIPVGGLGHPPDGRRRDAGLAPAVLTTFGETLPALSVFVVRPDADPQALQNLVLFAARTPIAFAPGAWSERVTPPLDEGGNGLRGRGLRLTDDYAPVEHLVTAR